MAPKQIKKQTTESKAESKVDINIQELQKEWADNTKDIITLREKLSNLEKHNNEIITKLVDYMNKHPTSNEVVVEAQEDKQPVKTTKKAKSADTEEVEPKEESKVSKAEPKEPKEPKVSKAEPKEPKESKVTKPAAKTAAKKSKETKEDDEEEEVEKPKEDKPVKKVSKAAPKEEVKKAPVKGKITAPSKGTPKPTSTNNDDGGKSIIEDSTSEDTDVDSLSSVSSESDASGGEDD